MKTTTYQCLKHLQYEGDKAVDLYATQKLFDDLIERYPECCDYLAPNSNNIVHSPIFESELLNNGAELSFAERITNNITAEKRQRTDISKYRSLKHVSKDSNMGRTTI